jgi:hypothetical protein
MPHRKGHAAEPKVSMASVQEAAPMRHSKSVSKKAAHAGASAAHVRGDMVRGAVHSAPAPKHSGFSSAPHGQAARKGQAPSATSLNGALNIIESPRKGRDHNLGIPGIISSTSLGPEQRQRLVSGIIESGMGATNTSGPVHAIMGHDSTAYNEGMVHIRGSSFK